MVLDSRTKFYKFRKNRKYICWRQAHYPTGQLLQVWRENAQVDFKGGQILKNFLVFPKDKDTITKQSSVIYWFQWDQTECDDKYMG